MTRKQLEFFLKTAELLNMTKAAKALYISQPSLSEQIHKLEEELGVALFKRSNRSLSLTTAGQVLVGEIHELFAKEQELRDAVRLAGMITKRVLRVRFLPGPFSEILPEIVHMFNKQYPEYQVELYDEDWNTITEDMNTLKYDLAFYLRIADCDFPQTDHIDLMEEECYYMMADNHPLARREKLTFEDVEYEIFCIDIKPETQNVKYVSLYSIFDNHGKKPNVLAAKNMAASVMVVRSSMAMAVASPKFLNNQLSGLTFVPSDELPTASLSVYWNKRNDHPAIPAFAKIVREYMKEHKMGDGR